MGEIQRSQPQSPEPAWPSHEDLKLDLQAALGTRRELGPDKEELIVEAFVERLGRAIDARVDARLVELERQRRRASGRSITRLTVSLVFAIPLTAIGGGTAGVPGILVAWAAIFLLNFLAARDII